MQERMVNVERSFFSHQYPPGIVHEAEKRGPIWALKSARLVGTLCAETYAYIHRYLNMDVHFIADERVKNGKQG